MPLDVGFPLAHHGVDVVEKLGEIAARLNVHLLCKEAFHGLKSLQTLPYHLKRIGDLFEVEGEALEARRQPLLGIAIDA